MPFALTIVELPRLRSLIVRDRDISWQHPAACAIPFGFPPVEIAGRRYVDGGFAGLPLWAAEELRDARRRVDVSIIRVPIVLFR